MAGGSIVTDGAESYPAPALLHLIAIIVPSAPKTASPLASATPAIVSLTDESLEMVTVGGEVYPTPGLVNVIEVTTPAVILQVAVAVVPVS